MAALPRRYQFLLFLPTPAAVTRTAPSPTSRAPPSGFSRPEPWLLSADRSEGDGWMVPPYVGGAAPTLPNIPRKFASVAGRVAGAEEERDDSEGEDMKVVVPVRLDWIAGTNRPLKAADDPSAVVTLRAPKMLAEFPSSTLLLLPLPTPDDESEQLPLPTLCRIVSDDSCRHLW